eukprot:Ihof_evm2s703 gene=Ihof_evmTU2s703
MGTPISIPQPVNTGKRKNPYAHTCNLPTTTFSMRSNPAHELKLQEDHCVADLYQWQLANNLGPEFVLHDGPPFANGKPHVGHALNKA